MQDKTLKQLLDKFEETLASGKSLYLDADEYDIVVEYYDSIDDLDKAKYILSLGLDIHPDSELLILRQARFMMYEKRYLDTINYLDKNFQSYEFDLFLLKIECYLWLNLYAEAYVLTQQVLEDKDNDKDVILSELGYVYSETGYSKDALSYLENSLEYNSDNEEVLTELVFVYESENNYEKAIEYCNKLLDIDPYNADVWLLLGKFYSLTGNYDKAIDSFEFYSTIKEDDLSSLRLKAHCFILVGRISEAIDMLLQCIDLAPNEEILYLSLIDCYIELEQYNDVLNIIDLFEITNETLNAPFLTKKALSYLKLKDYVKALTFIQEVQELDPEFSEINTIAIDVLSKLNNYKEALRLCDKVLLNDADNLLILDKAVMLSLSLNDYDRAIIYQKRILHITETSESKQKLILLYLENGDKEQFDQSIESCNDKTLLSIFYIFHKEELVDTATLSRDFLLAQLREVYNSRLYYKSMKN